MALYDDIITAQSQWFYPLRNKRLLIRTPISVVSAFNPPPQALRFFDPTAYDSTDNNNFVYMVLFPTYESEDNFQVQREYKSSPTQSAIATPSTLRRGFRATVIQPHLVFFKIMQQLCVISETSGFNRHTPIKVIDCCLPETSPNVSVNGDVGTIRYGRIDITKRPGGSISWENVDYCLGGWEFKFSDSQLRF